MLIWAMSVGLCLPLIALHWLISGVPGVGLLFLILFGGLGIFAGFIFAWLANREGRDLPMKRLFGGSIAVSMVITAIQFGVLFRGLAFVLYGAFGGVALGSLGAIIYMMVERGIKGREDPKRDNRYQKFIGRQRYRYTSDDELSLPPLDTKGASQERSTESADSAKRD